MSRITNVNYAGLFGYGGYGLSGYMSGMSGLYGSRTSDYSRIMRTYYNRNYSKSTSIKNASTKNTVNNRYNSSAYSDVSGLSAVKTEAGGLVESAGKLTNTGKNGLFYDREKYDSDAAYKAVKEFASNYNDTISAADQTGNAVVRSAAGSMTRMSQIMKNTLSKVGVTVEKDGRLSVDEAAFKSADMNTVKSVFGGTGSYTNMIVSSASNLENTANRQSILESSYSMGTYGRQGLYNSYYSGSWFNSFF